LSLFGETVKTRAKPGYPETMTRAYYDREADIAWFPTGRSDDVVTEEVTDGLRDYDRLTRELVAIEIWQASTRLPGSLLDSLPRPDAPVPA